MVENNQNEQNEETGDKCDHDWKPVERTHQGTHLQLKCTKCGKTKETYLFP